MQAAASHIYGQNVTYSDPSSSQFREDFKRELTASEKLFAKMLTGIKNSRAASLEDLNKAYDKLKQLPIQHGFNVNTETALCYEDQLRVFHISNEALELAFAQFLPEQSSISFSSLKDLPKNQAYLDGRPVSLILSQLGNVAHQYPVVIYERQGQKKAIILDSLGQGVNIAKIFLWSTCLVDGLTLDQVFTLDLKRQATWGDCRVFSMEDLMKLATTSLIDDLHGADGEEWSEYTCTQDNTRIHIINKLPPEFMLYSQEAEHADYGIGKTLQCRLSDQDIETDVLASQDTASNPQSSNIYILVRKIQLLLLAYKQMIRA